jgi:CHAD domain-containing protein
MVTADRSYQMLACHYIDSQLEKLCKEIIDTRLQKNAECVHQSRVASRRIRAAFVIFNNCFPKKKIRKWRKEIKSLTKGLGPARDADVMIEFLNQEISKLDKEDKTLLPGIRRLLLRTRQNRRQLQPAVIKTIEKLQSKPALADIHSEVQKILFRLKNDNPSVKSEYVFQTTGKHISSRLQELLSHRDCLNDPTDIQAHHKMRIAAKRLRYTMEICKEPYNGQLDDIIKSAKKLQTLLGDIHDCDVWVDHIQEFTKQELIRTREYFGTDKPYYLFKPGLEYLQQQRRQKRQQLFNELLVFWKKLCDDRIWDDLISRLGKSLTNLVNPMPRILEIKRPINEAKAQNSIVDSGHPCKPTSTTGSS